MLFSAPRPHHSENTFISDDGYASFHQHEPHFGDKGPITGRKIKLHTTLLANPTGHPLGAFPRTSCEKLPFYPIFHDFH
jgi:hypothetical protein